MTKPEDNAFPQSYPMSIELELTKKEYFAIKIIQGIISNDTFMREFNKTEISTIASLYADELIKELNK
jgi:hypothetical protein